MRNLILLVLVLFFAVNANAASSPAVSTAITTATASTTAAMYHLMNSNSSRAAKHDISKVFRNETISRSGSDIVVPCKVYWISMGIFETDGRVDVEKTLKKCDKKKSIIEQMNNVKYSFGKAKTFDPSFGNVYLELIQND